FKKQVKVVTYLGPWLDLPPKAVSSRLCQSPTRNLLHHCSFAYSALASFRMGMSGSASFRNAKRGSLQQAHALQEVGITRVRMKRLKRFFSFYVFHASRPLRVGFFQPFESMVAVSQISVVNRYRVGGDILRLRLVLQ